MLSFVVLAALVTCCMSGRTVASAPLSSLEGEWNITEINGIAVSPGINGTLPSIGFDLSEGRIYGNTGCNRIMSALNHSSKAGELDLSNMALTRMACPDMTTEQNILNTFANVKGYQVMNYDHSGRPASIALINAEKRPIVILTPKNQSPASSFSGNWNIVTIRGKGVPAEMQTKPFLSFDTQEKRVHGNAGCNTMNGSFDQEAGKANSLLFRQMVTTMMACPYLDTEREVLDSLEAVTYYETLSNGNLGLFNKEGVMLLELQRQ